MKIRRILSGIAAAVLMAGVVTGCGPAAGGGSSTASNDGNSNAGSNDAAQETTLTLWSIATESDSFHSAYANAIKDFETSHPGVKVVHETFENESYKTKIKSAVAANELPDVFYTWAGGFSQSFVDSGKVLDLSSYYENYKADLSEAAVANITYGGKVYGSTIVTPVSAMWYNQKIFKENNLEAPATWDDFVKVCQTLKDAGVTPIATSAKDKWVLAMLHDGLTLKSVGPDKLQKTLLKQGGSYSDPDFLLSAQKIKELSDMGAFIDGAAALSNDEASAEFYAGKAAMYFTGSWMGGSIMTDAANPDDFSVAPIPVVNDKNAKITDFMGGGADSLMVAASTKNADLSAEFAFELTKGISKYAYLTGAGIPAWKVNYDDSEVPALTKKVADYANGATSFTLWFDTLLTSEDANEYLALLQKLYLGSITPEDFQKEMAAQLEK
ncbi:extracellular solute-binding protein [Ruminococcus sp. HUN007]|uniref:extracellular solute-binding protein n=1 Tax=Ruminococcus sp. HUN007 TaxID=1514668 RepID=UPI0005D2BF0E|nr:extracellular solute-binding protein [Ruminococcus sp. HUN007]